MLEVNSSNASIATVEKLSLSTIHIVAIICYFIYGFIAALGNIVMILSMVKSRLTQYGGFLTLAHYAATDIISGSLNIIYLPVAIVYQKNLIPSFLPGFVLIFGEFSRKMFIVFMATTKFTAIMFPLSARRIMSRSWYRKAIFVTWVCCIISSLPFWICKSIYFDPVNYKWATIAATRNVTSIYGSIINLTVTVIILTTYPVCFYKLFKSNAFWNSNQIDGASHVQNRQSINYRERSLLYIFALNSVIFLLYWIPIYLFELWKLQMPYYGFFKETIRGIQIAYNPIVYYILNRHIRSAINNFVCCQTDTVTKVFSISRSTTTSTV